MKPEDWKKEWGEDNLIFASEPCHLLPPIAREFLISYGLPRRVIFENPIEGDWEEFVSSEITFELLSEPLVPYNTLINWRGSDGEESDEGGDDAWSQQIVIGEEEFCNGHASYCIHQLYGTVTYIDAEAMEPEIFVNSSLPQYSESLLLTVRWSKAVHQASMEKWKTSLYELAKAIEALDAAAFRCPNNAWPRLINYALENEPGFLEITTDLTRSKPRF